MHHLISINGIFFSFGLARVQPEDENALLCHNQTEYVATRWYRAPEVCGCSFCASFRSYNLFRLCWGGSATIRRFCCLSCCDSGVGFADAGFRLMCGVWDAYLQVLIFVRVASPNLFI